MKVRHLTYGRRGHKGETLTQPYERTSTAGEQFTITLCALDATQKSAHHHFDASQRSSVLTLTFWSQNFEHNSNRGRPARKRQPKTRRWGTIYHQLAVDLRSSSKTTPCHFRSRFRQFDPGNDTLRIYNAIDTALNFPLESAASLPSIRHFHNCFHSTITSAD